MRSLKLPIAAAVLGFPLLLCPPLLAQQITLLHTSDLHGHIYPFDYFRNESAHIGLARIATLVRQVREESHPVLLLDAGDTIQGSALVTYHHRRHQGSNDPMMMIMSHMGFDAMTVGNHEFNFGLETIDRALQQASFPWLSANIVRADGTPRFTPYIVREMDGVRVGIVGLTTPSIPNWESPGNYAGLRFLDTVEKARHYVSLLRGKENVDAVVVLAHQALESDLVVRLIKDVPGIDVLLLGHGHRRVSPRDVEGVVVCEPGRWGEALCRIDLFFEKETDGSSRLVRWDGVLMSARTVADSEDVLELAQT